MQLLLHAIALFHARRIDGVTAARPLGTQAGNTGGLDQMARIRAILGAQGTAAGHPQQQQAAIDAGNRIGEQAIELHHRQHQRRAAGQGIEHHQPFPVIGGEQAVAQTHGRRQPACDLLAQISVGLR